jgi:23S rRNA (uracil1939-C5)-methyltransferase
VPAIPPDGACMTPPRADSAPRSTPPPGRQVTVRFDRMGAGGEALAALGSRTLAVPYAAPGDRAVVRIVASDGGGLRGRLVKLLRSSPHIVQPRCAHFGVCGGCQWQHLAYTVQLEQKQDLVRDALREAGYSDLSMPPAVGWDPPWEYRTQMNVFVGARGDELILGLHAWGSDRIVNIRQCSTSHPALVQALDALRRVWPVRFAPYGRSPAAIRGVRLRVAETTGDLMVGFVVPHPMSSDDRERVVGAVLDQIPGLTGLVEFIPRPGAHGVEEYDSSLLWGRGHLRKEVLGVRLQVTLLADFPVNLRAFPGLLEMILGELDGSRTDALVELNAGIGAFTLHLALDVGRVIAVTSERDLDTARTNAALDDFANVTFVADGFGSEWHEAIRGDAIRLAFLHPSGTGLPVAAVRTLKLAGVRHIVYLAGALGTLARDVAALAKEGFMVHHVQPVDLTPQTSRAHALVTLGLS